MPLLQPPKGYKAPKGYKGAKRHPQRRTVSTLKREAVTYDKPVSKLGFKTFEQAGEAISVIELRMFRDYDEIDEFEEAVMGKIMEEMTEKEIKVYAEFLITQVQGSDEGVFSGVEFSG